MTRKPSAHFRRPFQKPKVDRSKPFTPALVFAVQFNMLTDEEIEDVRKGSAEINNSYLIYKSRRKIHIFKDRKLKILADRLLGLED